MGHRPSPSQRQTPTAQPESEIRLHRCQSDRTVRDSIADSQAIHEMPAGRRGRGRRLTTLADGQQ